MNATASAEKTQPVPSGAKAQQTWLPPEPPPDDFNWIQLTSGEWLKGEFKALYDDQVEFDSDNLDYYSKSEGTKTDDNHRLSSTYDIFKSKQFFWRPLLAEYYRDPFQNISYRVTLGAGGGYQLVDTTKTEWRVAAGPAFKYTKFENVEEHEADNESTPALWASTEYEHELNSRLDLILGYSTVIGNQQSGGYTHHALATLETELLSWLDFDVSFIWDRIQNPTPDSDGNTPEKDDFRFVVGLRLDY